MVVFRYSQFLDIIKTLCPNFFTGGNTDVRPTHHDDRHHSGEYLSPKPIVTKCVRLLATF